MADETPAPQYDEKTLSKQFLAARSRVAQGDPVAALNGLIGGNQTPPPKPSTAATPQSAPVSPERGGEAGGRDNPPATLSSAAAGPGGPPASSIPPSSQPPTSSSLGQRVSDAFHSVEGIIPNPFASPEMAQRAKEARDAWIPEQKETPEQQMADFKAMLGGKATPEMKARLANTMGLFLGMVGGEGGEGAAEARGVPEKPPAEGAPPTPPAEPGAKPPTEGVPPPTAEKPRAPGAAPPAETPPSAPPAPKVTAPPPFTIRGEEPPTTGEAPKPTPEARDAAVRYLNNQKGAQNPVQNSLRAMSNDATAQKLIEDIAPFVDREKIKPDDIRDMNAYSLQTDPFTVMNTLEARLKGAEGAPPIDELTAAANIAINSAAEQVGNLAKIAADSGLPEDYARALDAHAHLNDFVQRWTSAGTAMGRAMRTRQAMFDARTDYGERIRNAVLDQIGVNDGQKIIDHIARIEDPKKIAPFISALRWMKSRDGLLYGWYNAILSNYGVVGKKLLSDTTMLTWNLAVHYAAEKLGSGAVAQGETLSMLQAYLHSMGDAVKIAGRSLREGGVQFDPEHQTLEGQTYSRPWIYANGQRPWGETPLTEKTIEFLRGTLPTSLMGGIDDFYKTVNYRGELAALARREATKQIAEEANATAKPGPSGKILRHLTLEEIGRSDITSETAPELVGQRPAEERSPVELTHADEIQHRMQEILNNVPSHLHEQALAAAQRTTFVEEPLSKLGQKFADIGNWTIPIPYRNSMGDIGRVEIPAGRLILPFVRRPFNIMREAGRNSPAAYLMPSYYAALKEGGAAADLAKARAGLGTFVAITVGTLAMTRVLTGRGPTSPESKRAWEDAGNKPYTFYGLKYRTLEPWATIAATIADSFDVLRFAKDDATAEAIADSLVHGLGNSLLDASPLMGLQQFLDGLSSEGARNETWLESLLMSAEPSGLKAFKANIDPWQRAHHGLIENFWAHTPILSRQMPLEFDEWGDPIPDEAGFLPYWVHNPGQVPPGFDANSGKPTPIKNWINENQRAFPNNENNDGRISVEQKVPGTVSLSDHGVTGRYPLTTEQQSRYQQLAGQKFIDPSTGLGWKDAANALVKGVYPDESQQDRWNKGAPEDKARMLVTLRNAYRHGPPDQKGRGGAFGQLMSEYPEIAEGLRAQIDSQKQTIQQHRAQVGLGADEAEAVAGAAARGHVVEAPSMGATR